jgi:hypothetical protein
MRVSRSKFVVTALVFTVATSGCAVPQHSNTLLFATNTAVALDVSANATTAAPNITIGYKRQEMAWVPLLANQAGPGKSERKPADCPAGAAVTKDDPCVFLGRDGESVDAYSVLATFSGTAAASGSGGSTSPSSGASGSIAQFFATGMAARLLAEKGGAQLVNTSVTQTADQIVNNWQKQEQSDDQKLDAYFNNPANFAQLRDALVAKSKWNNTPTGDAIKQLPDKAAFMDWVRRNFAAHDLAAAVPDAGGAGSVQSAPLPTPAPAAAPSIVTPPATSGESPGAATGQPASTSGSPPVDLPSAPPIPKQ